MHVCMFYLTRTTIRKGILSLICLLALLFPSSCSLPWEHATACGTVTSTEALGNHASQAIDAGTCFFQAYQKCQAATFIYIDQDKLLTQDDEKTTRTFTIDTTACKVSEVVQIRSTSKTYLCDTLERSRGFLTLDSCGADGTFSLPLNAAIQ